MAYRVDKVDRDLLHQYLWKHRDRSGFIPWKSGVIADKLGIQIYTMSHILREMVDAGRLKDIGSKYMVVDPTLHSWGPASPEPEEHPRMF